MSRITDAATLNSRIRELAAVDPDPGVISEKILSEIDHVEARIIAELTLREHVRRTVSVAVPSVSHSYVTAAGERTPSAKTAARRDWVAAELARGLCVAPHEWRHLGKCGAPQLRYVAATRYAKADETRAEGERLDRIADLLIEHRIDLVEQLPRAVLEEVLKH
jgi:hypothetical protein